MTKAERVMEASGVWQMNTQMQQQLLSDIPLELKLKMSELNQDMEKSQRQFVISIFDEHFSEEELDFMLEFYTNPTYARIKQKMDVLVPLLVARMEKDANDILRKMSQ